MKQRAKKGAAFSLLVSALLGVTEGAEAVYLSANGVGQVLLYPYYTVREAAAGGVPGGFNTLVSVVNAGSQVALTKVRFIEGRNSREVLDFALYLSPYDVWTAAIVPTTDGAKILTTDRSCTVPPIPAGGVEFVNYAYAHEAADPAGGSLDRTREGYIEIIAMGTVTDPMMASYAVHTAGVPSDCAALERLENSGEIVGGLDTPEGMLFGSEQLVNVMSGVEFATEALALRAFTAVPLWYPPGSIYPNLGGVNPKVSTVQSNDGAMVHTQWTGITAQSVDPVSAVLMHEQVLNEYVLDPSGWGATDWVVTFPTKHFYYTALPGQVDLLVTGLFENNFSAEGACDSVRPMIYDREERRPVTVGFSPPRPSGNALCWETNVLTFNNSNLLGSRNAVSVPSPLPGGTPNGWMRLEFPRRSVTPIAGWTYDAHVLVGGGTTVISRSGSVTHYESATYYGLPTIGFAVINMTNGQLPVGDRVVLSNFAGRWTHRSVDRVTFGAVVAP